MILEVFSNLNDSIIKQSKKQQASSLLQDTSSLYFSLLVSAEQYYPPLRTRGLMSNLTIMTLSSHCSCTVTI